MSKLYDRAYTIATLAKPAPIPEAIRERCSRPGERAQTDIEHVEADSPDDIARAVAYLQAASPAIEGQGGDQHTFTVAARLKNIGVSSVTALELLLEHWNDRCEPPWTPEALEQGCQCIPVQPGRARQP